MLYAMLGENAVMYTNYFNRLVTIVAELCDMPVEAVLSKRNDQAVDARWIIVKILYEQGYHTANIAMLLKMTQRNVTHILNSFQDRLDQYDSLFKSTYQKARISAGNI